MCLSNPPVKPSVPLTITAFCDVVIFNPIVHPSINIHCDEDCTLSLCPSSFDHPPHTIQVH